MSVLFKDTQELLLLYNNKIDSTINIHQLTDIQLISILEIIQLEGEELSNGLILVPNRQVYLLTKKYLFTKEEIFQLTLQINNYVKWHQNR